MSKKLSFRGQIPPTQQEKINLATLNGKTGYRITKFQILSKTPGAVGVVEFVTKIYSRDQSGSIDANVEFTDGDLLAVAYYQDHTNTDLISSTDIIFDNEVFNQNIFVTVSDASGGTQPCNYYIELETVALSDIQSTQLTLKNLRTIASR
jgi:hypothetical protein